MQCDSGAKFKSYLMQTAPNKDALKRRLDRYFWDNHSGEMVFLRRLINENFLEFNRIAVIGGLVRDFAYKGRSGFRSDLDLVIDAPKEDVSELAVLLDAKPNRFGGFGCKQGPWKIDFWALETTWARRYVDVERLEDIVSCTFFDWDAIAYDLRKKKVICSEGYLRKIREKELDINFLPNPSPLGNLVRAVRRLVLWDAHAGPILRNFINEHLDDGSLKFIQEKEIELYSHAISTQWRTAAEAKKALLSNVRKKK